MVVLKLYVPSASRPGHQSKVRVEFRNNPKDLGLLERLVSAHGPSVEERVKKVLENPSGKPNVDDMQALQMSAQLAISHIAQERLNELLGRLEPKEQLSVRGWFDKNHDSRLEMMERLLGADVPIERILGEYRKWQQERMDNYNIPQGGDPHHFGGWKPFGGEKWQ
ncbi:MAG: hypothetical protein WCT31_05295 [Candidatus Micrarchaeia archaeon]|jgi:ribosome assembly protein YihI (activator of Der GTPase)